MAEIDRVGAYIVRIYSNEPRFEAPHVHVWRSGTWVKVRIPTKKEPAAMMALSRKAMAPTHVIEAVRLVEEKAGAYLAEYKRRWEERYGKETD